MTRVALAIGAHPDDIEFMMGGTLILLGRAGYELHTMNIANGSCGSATLGKSEIIAARAVEARHAAERIGAHHHPPIVDDLEIYYDRILVAKLSAIIREIAPQILLAPSPQDYMEDHTNACRLAVTAAFCRNIRNFRTDPGMAPIDNQMGLYHAQPYGLMDSLRNPIIPHLYVDITDVLAAKRDMLACHRSQKEWLDQSQGLDNYLITMQDMSAQVGKASGSFEYAEGWRQRSHLGFGNADFDPLTDALKERIVRADAS